VVTHGKMGATLKILRRSLILYLLGIFYYGGFSGTIDHIRLMGVLQGISDDLLRNNSSNDQGVLIALNTTLTAQTKSLTSDRDKLTTQEKTYSDQLTKQFTAMQSAVSSYKSIQSFMTQQIASWSKSS